MADGCANGARSETDDQAVIELEEIGKKQPKRILHFSDGILEEYDNDDEEEVDDVVHRDVVNPSTLSWLPFFWYYTLTFGTKTLSACDSVGEYLAYFFGITSPKYQYEIEEYKWMKQEREKEEKLEREQEEEEMKSWGGDKTMTTMQPGIERQRY